MPQPMVSIHISDEALQLWVDLFNDPKFTPYVENEVEGYNCFFCCALAFFYTSTSDDGYTCSHTSSCVYIRAEKLLAKMIV